LCAISLFGLTACESDEGGSTVLDAVVLSADQVVDAIESDEATYLTPVATGSTVAGDVSGSSGTASVSGWRSSMEYVPGDSQYLNFAEKLFVDLDGFTAGGVTLSGNLVVTRHSLDYGTGNSIDDASRMTHYVASVVAAGTVQGNFTIDVHANASGTTLWTCGTINDETTGSGACF
jgi:hypothetical protein